MSDFEIREWPPRLPIREIELACAIAYYNQKIRELDLAKAELKRLWAALSDVLPLAERYIGRSDGVSDATHDKIANARRALGQEDKG